MLDDGRSVAFDVKDYANIDHGYAATIHKAQGVTVDRVHVLATPGLDRHAAYVALSRHRDSVELHYGRDDFADRSKLVRTLSRERVKDMASDYTQAFADRHQIRMPAPAVERTATPPARNMFDGLKLRPQTAEPVLTPVRKPPDRSVELPAAVTRHARIVEAMRAAHSWGDAFTLEQQGELAASRAGLESIRPHAVHDLEAAMSQDLRLLSESADGSTARTIRAMQLEAELRLDPQLRADAFVQRWQGLERQRRSLMEYHEDTKVRRVSDTMFGMAKKLERDPQVESILRNRKVELGLSPASPRGVGQELVDIAGRGRSRGIGIGM